MSGLASLEAPLSSPAAVLAAGIDWTSPTIVFLAAVVVAALFAVAVYALLSSRGKTTRARLIEHTGESEPDEAAPEEGPLTRTVGTLLSKGAWWPKFEQEVDVANIGRSPAKVAVTSVGIGLVTATLLTAGLQQPLLGLAVIWAAPVVAYLVVRTKADRVRRQFSDQLADHLAVVAGAMRSGYSLAAALAAVLEDAPQPARREFERVVTDVDLGASLEEALDRVAQRMRSRDIEQVAMLAVVQRDTGSGTSEMLERVVATVRERRELQQLGRTLTAQGRLSRWILSLLPVLTLIGLTAVNPDFVKPLWTTGTGHLLLALAAVMVLSGSLVIKRIVDFRV